MEVNTTQVYEICDLIHKFEVVQEQLTNAFEEFINNKSIPLEDRWSIWVNSPDCLKKYRSWYHDWLSPVFQEGVMYEGVIYHTDRYQDVNVKDVFGRVSEMDEFELLKLQLDDEIINAEKENILSLNLGRFNYDW